MEFYVPTASGELNFMIRDVDVLQGKPNFYLSILFFSSYSRSLSLYSY
jgi:hypothetical protein